MVSRAVSFAVGLIPAGLIAFGALGGDPVEDLLDSLQETVSPWPFAAWFAWGAVGVTLVFSELFKHVENGE